LVLFTRLYKEARSTKHKKIREPSWFYLQDYTRKHGQQNIKKFVNQVGSIHKIIQGSTVNKTYKNSWTKLVLFTRLYKEARSTKHTKIREFVNSTKHKKIRAPSWFYLQDYTRKHGQQNIKKNLITSFLIRPNIFASPYKFWVVMLLLGFEFSDSSWI